MTHVSSGTLIRARVLKLALVAALALAGIMFVASTASAYQHSWSCSRGQYDPCYDTTGVTFNPWVHIQAGLDFAPAELCAKANNNMGVISPGSGCNNGFMTKDAYIAASPSTHAYSYYGTSSVNHTVYGWASTT